MAVAKVHVYPVGQTKVVTWDFGVQVYPVGHWVDPVVAPDAVVPVEAVAVHP